MIDLISARRPISKTLKPNFYFRLGRKQTSFDRTKFTLVEELTTLVQSTFARLHYNSLSRPVHACFPSIVAWRGSLSFASQRQNRSRDSVCG